MFGLLYGNDCMLLIIIYVRDVHCCQTVYWYSSQTRWLPLNKHCYGVLVVSDKWIIWDNAGLQSWNKNFLQLLQCHHKLIQVFMCLGWINSHLSNSCLAQSSFTIRMFFIVLVADMYIVTLNCTVRLNIKIRQQVSGKIKL